MGLWKETEEPAWNETRELRCSSGSLLGWWRWTQQCETTAFGPELDPGWTKLFMRDPFQTQQAETLGS